MHVAIFNLRFDETDPTLGHTILWARQFLKEFKEVHVYSVHVGRFPNIENLHIKELGGGSMVSKLKAAYNIILAVVSIIKHRRDFVVFYHMTERISGITSLFFRVANIKQALWYSHSSRSIWLKLSVLFCDFVYSPTSQSFPLKHRKVRTVGHGISNEFKRIIPFDQRLSNKILHLGRVSRIKQIENLIHAIERLNIEMDLRFGIDLVGPILDYDYWLELQGVAEDSNVTLNHLGTYPLSDISQLINKYKFAYTGNPSTIDKAAVEALSCGAMVITTVPTLWDHLHLMEIHSAHSNLDAIPPLENQLNEFLSHESRTIPYLNRVSFQVQQENSLKNLIHDISYRLKGFILDSDIKHDQETSGGN